MIVPAYNEAALLARLLGSLKIAADRAPGGAAQVELIVADNASTDATAEIARSQGCRVVPVAKRAIAAARNGGAREARGEWLCFVDADMRVHPDTFGAIDRAVQTGKVIGGATGVRSERWSPGIVATWAVILPMVWVTGLDTGVVFCRRSDFETIGGYREDRLYAEDVAFAAALKRLGRSRGQRMVRLRSAKAIVSTRKFDKHGDWHQLLAMGRLCWNQLLAPAKAEREVQAYWYEDR